MFFFAQPACEPPGLILTAPEAAAQRSQRLARARAAEAKAGLFFLKRRLSR